MRILRWWGELYPKPSGGSAPEGGLQEDRVAVDEYAAKMGDDDEIVTVAFVVKGRQVGEDLTDWFEKGYDFVLVMKSNFSCDRLPAQVTGEECSWNNRGWVLIEIR